MARTKQHELWRANNAHTRACCSPALLKSALRRPTPWIASVSRAIVLTIIIALPWVLVSSAGQQAEAADQVRLEVNMEGNIRWRPRASSSRALEQAALLHQGSRTGQQQLPGRAGFNHDRPCAAEDRPAQPRPATCAARCWTSPRTPTGVELTSVSTTGGGGGDEGGGGGDRYGGLLGDAPRRSSCPVQI